MWIFKDQDVEKLRIKGKVKGLIKLLEDDDPEIRASAAEALGDFDEMEVINALIRALRDRDRDVRWNSAKSLKHLCENKVEILIHAFALSNSVLQKVSLAWIIGSIGDARAIPALAESLKFGDKFVRRASVIAMGRIRDPTAIPHLINALSDYDEDVRKRSAEALGRIGVRREDVIKALKEGLMDESYPVRKACARSLERLGWEPEDEEELAKYLSALKMGSELLLLGEKALEPLIVALKDSDWSIKKWASDILREIKSEKTVQMLKSTLNTEDWAVKVHALRALAGMGEMGISAIAELVNDPDPNVSETAIEALSECIRGCEKSERERVMEELSKRYPDIAEKIKGLV
jgi:HEAT repeat protein